MSGIPCRGDSFLVFTARSPVAALFQHTVGEESHGPAYRRDHCVADRGDLRGVGWIVGCAHFVGYQHRLVVALLPDEGRDFPFDSRAQVGDPLPVFLGLLRVEVYLTAQSIGLERCLLCRFCSRKTGDDPVETGEPFFRFDVEGDREVDVGGFEFGHLLLRFEVVIGGGAGRCLLGCSAIAGVRNGNVRLFAGKEEIGCRRACDEDDGDEGENTTVFSLFLQLSKLCHEGGDVWVAFFGRLPHEPFDDGADRLRHVGADLADRLRLLLELFPEDVARRVPAEGCPTGQDPVEGAPQRVHVRTDVELLAQDPFG